MFQISSYLAKSNVDGVLFDELEVVLAVGPGLPGAGAGVGGDPPDGGADGGAAGGAPPGAGDGAKNVGDGPDPETCGARVAFIPAAIAAVGDAKNGECDAAGAGAGGANPNANVPDVGKG